MRYSKQSAIRVHCNTRDGISHPVYPYPTVLCIAPLGLFVSQPIFEEVGSYLRVPEVKCLHIAILASENDGTGDGRVPGQRRDRRQITVSLDRFPGFRRIYNYCPIISPTGQMFPVGRRPYNID